MSPSAVIFDAFGTVIDIERRAHPYRMLLREGARQGRRASAADLKTLMTTDASLPEAAELLKIRLTAVHRKVILDALETELASMVVYPDATLAIEMLLDAGMRVGICSNLSQAYGSPLRALLPQVSAFALSYQLGVMKPDPEIYQSMCYTLGVRPDHDWIQGTSTIWMVGDSPRCDRDGPRALGIRGYHLARGKHGAIRDLVHFASLLLAARE